MRKAKDAIKFTIWARLVIGYMIIMVLVIFMGAYVTLKLNQFNGLTRGAASDGTLIGHIENLIDTLLSQVSFERKFLISGDTDFYRKFEEIRDIFISDYQSHIGDMGSEEKKYAIFRNR